MSGPGASYEVLLTEGAEQDLESIFQRYRLIYRVMDASVIVYTIADGRRDMQSLLERRLFES